MLPSQDSSSKILCMMCGNGECALVLELSKIKESFTCFYFQLLSGLLVSACLQKPSGTACPAFPWGTHNNGSFGFV
jgi:hypothetical protein